MTGAGYREILLTDGHCIMNRQFGDVNIEVRTGDITAQADVDAIANAANRMLETGGGVAGAIHRAAGAGLAEEARRFAPIEPGEAVITGGHRLPNRYVIHCLGPVYGVDMPSDALLSACYGNALRLADEKAIRSIAFPAISTGVFGYPMAEAADVAIRTVVERAPNLSNVTLVRFVLFDNEAAAIHGEVLANITT
jgi:O-acetyl-ADP-ribose deacetylase